MLQSAPSRELLELWAPDPKNGLIVTGYSVEGTLARVRRLTHLIFEAGLGVVRHVDKYDVNTQPFLPTL